MGSLLFLVFINDIPKFVNDKSVPILFADDTTILLSHSNPNDFNNNINTVFKILSDCFKQNLLSLNFTKTQFTDFTTKNNNQIEINVNYNNKFIPTVTHKKFPSLTGHCSLTWINHLSIIYHSLFHSIMSYGIIFWGNSSHSSVIFKIQKRVIEIIVGYDHREF